MNTYSANNTNKLLRQCPKVFSHKQTRYGYSVVFVHYANRNDWHNNITMKDLYNKGFYQ